MSDSNPQEMNIDKYQHHHPPNLLERNSQELASIHVEVFEIQGLL